MTTQTIGSAEQPAKAMQVDNAISGMNDGDKITFNGHVTVTRSDDGQWTVKSKGATTFTTPSRKEAIVRTRQVFDPPTWGPEPDLIAKQEQRRERAKRKAERERKAAAKTQAEKQTDAA